MARTFAVPVAPGWTIRFPAGDAAVNRPRCPVPSDGGASAGAEPQTLLGMVERS
ncbi:hypothetical protein [Fodinicola feengrottensis]|uniref:hypothetical protein n=1 Tax=Fodinicola feengrottensis TaxID=435914 RepID=UPI0024410EFC|nr:hypothetical protein [Fodinicola feengrottensis]